MESAFQRVFGFRLARLQFYMTKPRVICNYTAGRHPSRKRNEATRGPTVPRGGRSRQEGSWPGDQEQSLSKKETKSPADSPVKVSFHPAALLWTIVTKQFQVFITTTFSLFVLFYSNGYKIQGAEKYLSGYINLLSLFHIPNLYSELSALQV